MAARCCRMAYYYFHMRNGGDLHDPEGHDLPDLDAVRATAIAGARDILSEDVKRGELHVEWRFDITDADGEPVMTVPFRDAVDLSHV